MTSETLNPEKLSGRNRRLFREWQVLEDGLQNRPDICCRVVRHNTGGLPTGYEVDYHIRSICGVTQLERFGDEGIVHSPLFADHFTMLLELPEGYPQVDAPPVLTFLTRDAEGHEVPHPWHPNIRYFGSFAGRVCINMADTYTDLLWAVRRVAAYLRYDIYHATLDAPFPEDLQVAKWVREQGEPNGWTKF